MKVYNNLFAQISLNLLYWRLQFSIDDKFIDSDIGSDAIIFIWTIPIDAEQLSGDEGARIY